MSQMRGGVEFMKLGIFGSRTLKDDRVRELIYDEIQQHKVDMIVTTQEPLGVCTVAQQVAKEAALPLELHFLNFQRYARGAFHERSLEVIRASDRVLLIHDGESSGTKNELLYTKRAKKPYRYEVLEATDEDLQRRKDKKLEAFGKELDLEFDLDFDFDGGDE